jgi:hypothetical protein
MASQATNFQGFEDPGASHIHDGGKPRYQSRSDDSNASNESLDLLSSNETLKPGLESTTGELMDWSDLYLPLRLSLEDEDTELTRHYFSSVCRIQSCVDSSNNFFRGEIGSMMASSPLIYHCVLSMSAAHLANIRGHLGTTALDHRTKAITCLKLGIMNMKNEKDLQSCSAVYHSTEALLGSILLGMTDVGSYGWGPLHRALTRFSRVGTIHRFSGLPTYMARESCSKGGYQGSITARAHHLLSRAPLA